MRCCWISSRFPAGIPWSLDKKCLHDLQASGQAGVARRCPICRAELPRTPHRIDGPDLATLLVDRYKMKIHPASHFALRFSISDRLYFSHPLCHLLSVRTCVLRSGRLALRTYGSAKHMIYNMSDQLRVVITTRRLSVASFAIDHPSLGRNNNNNNNNMSAVKSPLLLILLLLKHSSFIFYLLARRYLHVSCLLQNNY
jgi:hypothetical protein